MNQVGDLFPLKLLGVPQEMPVLTKEQFKAKTRESQVGLISLLSKIDAEPYFQDKTKSFILFKEDTLKLLPLIPD